MHITPVMIEAMYELLRTTPPFRGWHLPDGDEVEFRVINSNSRAAEYYHKADGTHYIGVNNRWVGTLTGLQRAMAHEMCHLKHAKDCPNDQAIHGKWFNKYATLVCRHHMFDPKAF